ncbi:MAG: arylsulfatase, partial [Planctomycetota bacterium]
MVLRLAPILALAAAAPWSAGRASAQDAAARAAGRPNVVLVMADDLGIGDVSPTNPDAKIATPHLAKLAAEGMTFLDAHSTSAVCTPTRYALMTGRYNWRSRLERGVLGGWSDHLIPADRPTVAHMLRDAGYATAMVGKWHLGWDWSRKGEKKEDVDFTKPVRNGPDINGFDRYFAHNGSLDMPPYVWVDTGRVTAVPDRVEGVTRKEDRYGWYREGPIGSDFHIDEVLPLLFGKAVSYVEERAEAARGGDPFFLYLALPAPHTPIVPVPPFAGASGLNPYADFVMQVDHHMGELLAALEAADLEGETIVVFTSDNGCSPEANFALLREKGHDPCAGYRGHKADIYEGGHRVPLVVRWPGRVPAGTKTRALACLTDVYATLRDVTGGAPEAVGGEDGHSWVPLFEGEESSGRTTLVSHSVSGHFAIREGPWKLCLAGGSGGWSAPKEKAAREQGLPPVQLFHLGEDPGERRNLVDEHPERVAALLRTLDEEVRRGRWAPGAPGAEPSPGPVGAGGGERPAPVGGPSPPP